MSAADDGGVIATGDTPPEPSPMPPEEESTTSDDESESEADELGVANHDSASAVTEPSMLRAPIDSALPMKPPPEVLDFLLGAAGRVPAPVQIKKGVRKHTWEDEVDILMLQGKRRARLEAGVRDNNLRAWAMATGCAAAVAMKERRDLASHLFALVGLVGDDSGHFLLLDKLADLLIVLRLPDVLAKVRKYMREQKKRRDVVSGQKGSNQQQGAGGQSLLFRPGAILVDDFIMMLTDFKIEDRCNHMKKAVVASEASRKLLDLATLFAEYRRKNILSGLAHQASPMTSDAEAQENARLVTQLELAAREAKAHAAPPPLLGRRRRSSVGRRGSIEDLIGMVGAAKDDAAAAAAAAASVAPSTASGSGQAHDLSQAGSAGQAASTDSTQKRRACHRLRQYMRSKELRATDQEQDPADYDVMKPTMCALPVGDLLEGRRRRDRGQELEQLKDEAYDRLVEARRAHAREVHRRVRAYLSLTTSSGRYTVSQTASTLTADSCLAPSVLSYQTPSTGFGGSKTSRQSTSTAPSSRHRPITLKSLPVANAWGKMIHKKNHKKRLRATFAPAFTIPPSSEGATVRPGLMTMKPTVGCNTMADRTAAVGSIYDSSSSGTPPTQRVTMAPNTQRVYPRTRRARPQSGFAATSNPFSSWTGMFATGVDE